MGTETRNTPRRGPPSAFRSIVWLLLAVIVLAVGLGVQAWYGHPAVPWVTGGLMLLLVGIFFAQWWSDLYGAGYERDLARWRKEQGASRWGAP